MTVENASVGGRAGHVGADELNRVVKMAVDSGEAATIEASYELFRTYRLCVVVGPEVATSAVHQAALLTIVNTARRAMLGGVFVFGDMNYPLLAPLPGYTSLHEAVTRLGGHAAIELIPDAPTLVVGSAQLESPRNSIALRVTFEDWRGGVIPAGDGRRFDEASAISPAAPVLAGAVGVSEVFQHHRGNPMAGRRSVGLSLWNPEERDWTKALAGPTSIVLPSDIWLIGLGHLGQAYLWTLGLLPYKSPGDVRVVLHDFDRLTPANDSTSLLTSMSMVGQLKTRAMANWAEARGFKTSIVERIFPGGMRIANDEPRLALGGVDNLQARAAYEDAGFDCIVEAGLGAGPAEYLAMRIHTFPASTTARAKWGGPAKQIGRALPRARAYDDLAAQGMDECGLVRLETRTVGAPFVGATASALVVSEVLRRLNGGEAIEVADITLRDLDSREVVAATSNPVRFNPGFTG